MHFHSVNNLSIVYLQGFPQVLEHGGSSNLDGGGASVNTWESVGGLKRRSSNLVKTLEKYL